MDRACVFGDVDMIRMLLYAGARINTMHIFIAATFGNYNVIPFIISLGVNTSLRNLSLLNVIPSTYIVKRRDRCPSPHVTSSVDIILEHEPDIDSPKSGLTPLMFAFLRQDDHVVRSLILRGASIHPFPPHRSLIVSRSIHAFCLSLFHTM